MKILATYNLKGGVGKTSSAVNLAYLAARDGYRTLLWDLDPQGAASFYFRVKPKLKGGADGLLKGRSALDDAVKATDFDGLDLIPADFSFRNLDLALGDTKKPTLQLLKLLRPVSREYDLLFIDSAPSISLVSENIFRAADVLLVPMIPTTLSARTLEQLTEFLSGHAGLAGANVKPFFSMVDRRKRMHLDLMERLPERYPNILETSIPYAADVERMGVHRMPLPAYAPSNPASHAYAELWQEIKADL